jgi:hypothetical protein
MEFRPFSNIPELPFEAVKQKIEEFIYVHLNMDIDRKTLEIDNCVSQFLREGRFVVS